IYEKGRAGGWATLLATGLLVAVCFWIRRHYQEVLRNLRSLDDIIDTLPPPPETEALPIDPKGRTAVLLVGPYGGLGIHSLLSVQQLFPGQFRNFVFVSIGVIDTATMKGVEEVDQMAERTKESQAKYVELARRLGLRADSRMRLGTEVVDT